ncbi:hypothetical protein TRVA0_044S01332 [Trichomonascus vanleenenianus]|uniref:Mrx7p n=1 Tax=Trichomonascus vanleenenianus TaxID=2268995 RepID=UPI003EC973CA
MWQQDLHRYIVKKLLESHRFHRFVQVTNARIKGEPVPPPIEDDGPKQISSFQIFRNKARVYKNLFFEELRNEFRSKR